MTIVVGDPSWMPSELPIGNGPLILPSPWKPMDVARFLVGVRYSTPDGVLTLRDWRGDWWSWCGSQWHKTEIDRVRTDAYRFTEHAYYEGKDDLIRWAPSRQKIANLLEALRAVVHGHQHGAGVAGWTRRIRRNERDGIRGLFERAPSRSHSPTDAAFAIVLQPGGRAVRLPCGRGHASALDELSDGALARRF